VNSQKIPHLSTYSLDVGLLPHHHTSFGGWEVLLEQIHQSN